MYYSNIAPWEHYPKNLRFNEVQNPLRVIIDFFSAGWPKNHRRDLKKWRHYIVNDEHYNDQHGPGTILFVYDLNVKLIEAMHLLLCAYKKYEYNEQGISVDQLEAEKQEWVYFPKNLSEAELLNPYKAIKKCFKTMKPQDYRDYLHEWLHYALYKNAVNETMLAGEIITVYENLRRLYSAAWLIHQRDTERTLTRTRICNMTTGNSSKEASQALPIQLKDFKGGLNSSNESALKEIEKLILEKFALVQAIVCIGKHDNPFTYYLVILIDEAERIPEHEIGNKIEDNCRYLTSVCAIVHKTTSAIAGLNAGQRFWSNVFSNRRIIYTAPGLELPKAQTITKEIKIARATFHWHRWGDQGKAFLKGAERYYAEGNYSLAAFLLHQSVESILKSMIQVVTGYRVQMHNLSRLLKLTLLFTDDLQKIFELDTEEGKRIFIVLRSAYTDTRYKNDFEIEKESIDTIIIKTKTLISIAEQIYTQYIEYL